MGCLGKSQRSSFERCKAVYVESMLRILRRFSDRHRQPPHSGARELFGQVAQRVMDGSLALVDSDDESVTDTESDDQQRLDPTGLHQPTSGPSRQMPPPVSRHLAPNAPSVTGTSTAATRGGGDAAISPGRTPLASETEEDTSEEDRLGSQPGPFRGPSRHPSSQIPPSSSHTSTASSWLYFSNRRIRRGPPSRSHMVASGRQDPSYGQRPRGPPSLQSGYSVLSMCLNLQQRQ